MRIMKVFLIIALVVVSAAAQAQQQPTTAPSAPPTQDEISALRAEIAELKAAIAGLQSAVPKKQFLIGVMPIENAGRIPQVGYSFRQLLVSAFNEAGVKAVESLDDETLRWVQRQDQLVRERWIDPLSSPPRGELKGVPYFLLATVTNYNEEEVEDVKVFGIITIRTGGGVRIRRGSLVVDFRLVDARTGDVIDAFRSESTVKRKEYAGGVYPVGGTYRHEKPLPEAAARAVAEQAAERIAILVNSTVVTPTATAR